MVTFSGSPFNLANEAPASTGINKHAAIDGNGRTVLSHPFGANVMDHSAAGTGAIDDTDGFTSAKADGGLVFVPKPPSSYTFATNVPATESGAFFLDPSATWDNLTDGGKLKITRTRGTNIDQGSSIWRFADRVFVGGGAQDYAGTGSSTDPGNSWLGSATIGPAYLPALGGILYMSGGNSTGNRNPPVGIVSAMSSATTDASPIGFGAAIIADAAGKSAWGFIAETQRENGAVGTIGMEFAIKNKGEVQRLTPNAQTPGAYGAWFAAGSDPAFGGAPTNPSTAAIALVKNGSTWQSGIVMLKDSLTDGEAISLSSEGVGGAHHIAWYDAAGDKNFLFRSLANDAVAKRLENTSTALNYVVGSATLLSVGHPASVVNGFNLFGSATGAAVQILPQGSDTDIAFTLRPKAAGEFGLASGDNTKKIRINNTGIGFFNTAPIAKPTVTGSRGSNAALASLLTALANYGILTDSSS